MTDVDTFLSVSFQDKDEAKSKGAKWDSSRKQWFAPAGSDEAMAHLRAVNNWDTDTANAHALSAFAEWEVRSQKVWKLDVTWLKGCGIKLSQETTDKLLHYETHLREPGQKPTDMRAPAPSNSIKILGEDVGEVSVADAMSHFF